MWSKILMIWDGNLWNSCKNKFKHRCKKTNSYQNQLKSLNDLISFSQLYQKPNLWIVSSCESLL